MQLGSLLKRALDLTLHHPVLWLFALVSALPTALATLGRRLILMPPYIPAGSGDSAWTIVGLLRPAEDILGNGCLTALLQLAGALLTCITTGAVIASIDVLKQGQETTFAEGWRSGTRHWAQILGIGLLTAVPLFALALLVVLGAAALEFGSSASDLTVLGLLCLVPVGLAALIYVLALFPVLSYGYRFIVLRERTAGRALREGWGLLRSKPAPSLAVLFLLLLCALPNILLALGWETGNGYLIAQLGRLLWTVTRSANLTVIAEIGVFGVVSAAVAIAGILFTVFDAAVWSLAFEDLAPAPETAFQL